MTLIAAMKCDTGFLLCADTQETVTTNDGESFRQPVGKIVQVRFGTARGTFLFAGAGHGPLIDSFEVRLRRQVTQKPPITLQALLNGCEHLLGDFYRVDVARCPDEDKRIQLLFAASLPDTGEYGVWIAQGIRLQPVTDWTLFGADYPLYRDMLRRLHRSNPSIGHATLATLYVFSVAGDTSNVVGRDADVFFIDGCGVWKEPEVHVRAMQARLREYEKRINDAFLACSDTGVSTEELRKRLNEFQDVAVALHQQHIATTARDMFAHGLNLINDPYPRIPPGSLITAGPGIHVYEPETLKPPSVEASPVKPTAAQKIQKRKRLAGGRVRKAPKRGR